MYSFYFVEKKIDITKQYVEELIKKYKLNHPVTYQEWNIICSSQKWLNSTDYNQNGSIKSVSEYLV